MPADTEVMPRLVHLTGFLGAGKTTLLRHLVRQPGFADSFIIVNEFARAGLDGLILREVSDAVSLLSSGCLCCTQREALLPTLEEGMERYWSLKRSIPSYIFIETSGLAIPQLVDNDALAACRLAGNQVITVVDGASLRHTAREFQESVAQIAVADLIVVSAATGPYGQGDREEIHSLLKSLNPHAPLIELPTKRLEGEAITTLFQAVGRLDNTQLADRTGSSWPSPEKRTEFLAARHHSFEEIGVTSLSLFGERLISKIGLELWLSVLRNHYGRNLLRLKALLTIDGRRVLAEGVQGCYSITPLPRLPEFGRTDYVIDAIGVGLNDDAFGELMAALSLRLDTSRTSSGGYDQFRSILLTGHMKAVHNHEVGRL